MCWLVVAALLALGLAPYHEPLTNRQARLVIHSYAQAQHLGRFHIRSCKRLAQNRITCKVEEAGYTDGLDRYSMGVKRQDCGFYIRDCGSGTSCRWQRWL